MGRFPAYEEHARILTWTGLIAGVAALISPMVVASVALKRDGAVMLGVALVFSVVSLAMPLGRSVGAVLVAALAASGPVLGDAFEFVEQHWSQGDLHRARRAQVRVPATGRGVLA